MAAATIEEAALLEQQQQQQQQVLTEQEMSFYTTLSTLKVKQTLLEQQAAQATLLLEQQAARATLLSTNQKKIETMLTRLNKTVGHTWYVFSGATPSGWDCSGLVRWTYQQAGVELEHRASKQALAGTPTKDPKAGDIVAFTYKGSNSAYHVGIYIGDGNMIHAPAKGHVTRVESVEKFGGDYSKITFTSPLEH